MSNDSLSSLVDVLKLLAHPARLRILALLRDGELCVCQIVDVLGIPASTTSEHLTELRRGGLLVEQKEGRWVYYGLSPKPGLEALLEALWPHVDRARQVAEDRQEAQATRAVPIDVTCNKTRSCHTRMRKEPSHA